MTELEKTIYYLKEKDWVTGTPTMINSGKEAAVYLCEATQKREVENFALKVYHPANQRNFSNRKIYYEGWTRLDPRAKRAIKRNNRIGRNMVEGMWINTEYNALETLYEMGADVPKPYLEVGKSILMDFIGKKSIPATPLFKCKFDKETAEKCYDKILENIELFLFHDKVHSDLSPYNILFDGEKIVIIDFPQIIDARSNHNAEKLLLRDIQNITNWAMKFGIENNAQAISLNLWSRYERMEL